MPSPLTPIASLAPGSNQLAIAGLIPSTQYTIVVAHMEPAPSTGTTEPQQVTFTTGPGTSTAATPQDPIPFVVAYPSGQQKLCCGVAAYQAEPLPGTQLVFLEAVETAVGSGIFGAYEEVDRVLADPATLGVHTAVLTLDGLRRSYQVYATHLGILDSGLTTPVTLLPGTPLAPADQGVPVPSDLSFVIQAMSSTTVAWVATYTPPETVQFDHMEYTITAPSEDAQTVVGGAAGADTIVTFTPNSGTTNYIFVPYTVSRGAPAGAFLTGVPVAVTRVQGDTTGAAWPT